MLEITNASCGYKNKHHIRYVIKNLDFNLSPGEILCMLGSNGIGKTTLFRSVLGSLQLLGGDIRIDGTSLLTMTKQDRAKLISYVPQSHTPPFPYKVLDVVLMGRAVHINSVSAPKKKDIAIAMGALERLQIISLSERIYTQISGGERQLVLIARALVQDTKYLLMDEPTSNLDYGNQIRVLKVIKMLAREGKGVLFTSHYPDHAFLCDSNVVIIESESAYQKGYCKEVINEEIMKNIYQIDTKVIEAENKNGEKVNYCIPFL